MLTWKLGVVTSHRQSWTGACELTIEIDGSPVRGLAYEALTGVPEIGETVQVSADGVDLGLGTGGYVFVVARKKPASTPPAGHLMKARYTPMQVAIAGVDEQGTEHYEVMKDADSLEGLPVITADLHSSLPAIIHGIRFVHPQAQIAYIHTDTASLPIWFSKLASRLRESGDIAASITTGQSFGGDLEAVNLYTGLLAARHVVGADVAVVIHGPGNVGTGSRWGFSGTACGETINAVHVLGGRPIATLRVSAADPRERHQGLSHHSLTAYGRVALAPAIIPISTAGTPGVMADVAAHLSAFIEKGHTIVEVDTAPVHQVLSADTSLRSMGRSYADDPDPFIYAAAAGMAAMTRP